MASALVDQPCYTYIDVSQEIDMIPRENIIKETLENGGIREKVNMLKKLIYMVMSGEKVNPSVLMYVIRFCLPLQDHLMKKLLLVFWEIIPKTTTDGRLLQEMILVCDAYLRDLQHPNEFVRGSTLRFLCKLKEPELLEPLMQGIRSCLEHRHSYVRRNAVLAAFTIYKNFEFLIPDAPELIQNFLESEQDASCKRNAFMMLLHVDQQRALDYLGSCLDQVAQFGDILQLIIVELIYNVCHANPNERSRFIRCIYNMLQSNSAAVRYEAAGTLLALSSVPTAIKASANVYIDLIAKESDNNVKLIVLDHLMVLRQTPNGEKVLQESVMDILQVLSSPDLEVRKKTLQLALDVVSGRNVAEVVLFLCKEVTKTASSTEQEDAEKYRQILIRTLHSVSIAFPVVAQSIIPTLMEFLSDSSELAALDVLEFIREAIHRLPDTRPVIFKQMQETFSSVRSAKVFRSALWILGEYSESVEEIQNIVAMIRQSLGDLPLVSTELEEANANAGDAAEKGETKPKATQLVTADGTYATQSVFNVATKRGSAEKPLLRRFLLNGEFFIGAALGTVSVKITQRFLKTENNAQRRNQFVADMLYMLVCIVNLGISGIPKVGITDDDLDHMSVCIRLLCQHCPAAAAVFLEQCRDSLDELLAVTSRKEKENSNQSARSSSAVMQVDDRIVFSQLLPKVILGDQATNVFELSLSQALGTVKKQTKFNLASSKLDKVHQLSGFSDPVYAEAYVNVNQYDIVLDVLVVNQTADTLEGLSLELATLGDLKLVDKPSPITLAPHDFANIKASVKIASTENGIIFGTIVYDVRGSTGDRNCVYLNDIHIDIMDYVVPASCTDAEFRMMWVEFEWENKVVINTPVTNLKEYLHCIIKSTNMRCLTPDEALAGDSDFLAANLYAHSIFGEVALANISIEKANDSPDAPVAGHIRIRAKSQGMALSLGDKINSVQKSFSKLPATVSAV